MFNTSAEVGPDFLYMENMPFNDCNFVKLTLFTAAMPLAVSPPAYEAHEDDVTTTSRSGICSFSSERRTRVLLMFRNVQAPKSIGPNKQTSK